MYQYDININIVTLRYQYTYLPTLLPKSVSTHQITCSKFILLFITIILNRYLFIIYYLLFITIILNQSDMLQTTFICFRLKNWRRQT